MKRRIHAMLKAVDAYAVNYIGGQYAANGTPDILGVLDGRFLAIEAKAGKGRPTQLQLKALRQIDEAGGLALVINETNLDYLEECLRDITNARSNWRVFDRPQEDLEQG